MEPLRITLVATNPQHITAYVNTMTNPNHNIENVRLRTRNLRLFLELVSETIAYPFSDGDWDAIEYGLTALRAGGLHSYEYPLIGPSIDMNLSVSYAETLDVVNLTVSYNGTVLTQIGVTATLLKHLDRNASDLGLTELLTQLFAYPRFAPGARILPQTSRAEHDLQIEGTEYYEVQRNFSSMTWQELAATSVPMGWATIHFLTLVAQRYFLLAYIMRAIIERDMWIFETAVNTMHRDPEGYNEEQRALIELLSRLLPELCRDK